MSFNYEYEKVSDNIMKYATKSGKVKYRVVITINNVPIDKSGLKNVTEAKNFIKAKTAEILNGTHQQKESYATFEQYYAYYLKKKTTPIGVNGETEWNLTTQRTQGYYFKNNIMPHFGKRLMSDVTRIEFEKFAESLVVDRKLRTKSAREIVGALSAMLNHAVYNEELDKNRLFGIKPPTSENPPIDKEVSKEQFEMLFDYFSKKPIYIRIRFILLAIGLRRSEVNAVRYKSIEFVDNSLTKITIDTSRPEAYLEGKGTKTNTPRVMYGTSRMTPIIKEYIAWLKVYLAERGRTLHKDDWLVISHKTGRPIHPTTVSFTMKEASEALGFKVSPHKLRHHFATQAKLEGIDIRWIADALGHQSLTTTEGYTHGEGDSARKVAEIVKFI